MELRNCDVFQLDDVVIFAFSVASGTTGSVSDVLVILLNCDALIGSVSELKLPSGCCARKLVLKDEKEMLPEV
jgi:hypothetical protein